MPIVKANEKAIKTGAHFMQGNYAIVEGAIAAGCNFFAGYPITPANEISEWVSKRLPEVGGVYIQGEDEICSIYACAGAALAGAKAMTATSSEGFNYMQEGFAYCHANEVPMVVVNVQRTRGETYATQSDVMQMKYGANGDAETVVLCPSSVQEQFDYMIWAFNIAEQYRTPVFVESETVCALMRERLDIPKAEDISLFNRKYTNLSPDELIPWAADKFGCPDAIPLAKGYHTLYSICPKDQYGNIEWVPDEFDKMHKRICGKIFENRNKIGRTEEYMLNDAEIALVAYGSEVRPTREAVGKLRNAGIKAGMLRLCNVWPCPEDQIKETGKNVKTIFAVEMNMGKYCGEIERVVKGSCNVVSVPKNKGNVHTSDEIVNAVKEGIK